MLPPSVSATVAPASAVPVIVAVCSLALTTSSPATSEIVGAVGATVSSVMTRDPSADTLPAASVAEAVTVSVPWPMAVKSAAVRA